MMVFIGIYTILLILINLFLFMASIYVGKQKSKKTTMGRKIISTAFLLNVLTLFGGLIIWVF